jgi:hypothetical protein
VDRATAMLGGLDNVAAALNMGPGKGFMRVSFRPEVRRALPPPFGNQRGIFMADACFEVRVLALASFAIGRIFLS